MKCQNVKFILKHTQKNKTLSSLNHVQPTSPLRSDLTRREKTKCKKCLTHHAVCIQTKYIRLSTESSGQWLTYPSWREAREISWGFYDLRTSGVCGRHCTLTLLYTLIRVKGRVKAWCMAYTFCIFRRSLVGLGVIPSHGLIHGNHETCKNARKS